jgi:hypothetical protein
MDKVRKGLLLVMVAALCIGSIASAEAKKSRKISRVAEATYAAPAYFQWAPTGDNIGGASFPTTAAERFISIEIEDTSGLDVSAAVGQDPENDGTVDNTAFCTKTDKPLPISPGLPVTVFVFVGPCTSPPGPAFATQGTITATFSNQP